jgi:hypothetical protein
MMNPLRLLFISALLALVACGAPPGPLPVLPTTSAVEPLKFELIGNGIGVNAYAQGEKIEAGKTATVKITFEPLVVQVSRKSDGSIEAISTTLWTSANISEMQVCSGFDKPCELAGKWIPFAREQEIKIDVDWLGARELWVKAQFRDSTGAIVSAFSRSSYELPKEAAQTSARLVATIDERTPSAALPAKIQTLVAATRTAFPVTGFAKIENGRTVAGGKAGSTIEVKVQFGATSPLGDVKEMRVRDFRSRKCASETEMNEAAWEPVVAEKIYKIGVVINFTSFDVSAQYRDAKGNLSPIYCADLAVEGMP